MARTAPMSREEAQRFADLWNRWAAAGGTTASLADDLGINRTSIFEKRNRTQSVLGVELPTMTGAKGVATRERMKQAFRVEPLPSRTRPFEEILAERTKSTTRRLKAEFARELVNIDLAVDGPFGIAMIGDPHVDSPTCNLQLLMDHTDVIVKTEGMFAICVGDVQDNWVGRLFRLWAMQGIDAMESQVLADGWLKRLQPKLLALCAGNHDVFVEGVNGQTPLDWIRAGGAVMEKHGVRLRMTTRDKTQITINMRHDFPGRSQFNAAHGPTKSLLFGCRDDVAVAGHTHEFGRGVRLDPDSRKPMHAVRLGSYKHSDDYAKQNGFLDNNVSECSVLMVDPAEKDTRHRTWVEDNPFRAARVLKLMRAEHEGKRNVRRAT